MTFNDSVKTEIINNLTLNEQERDAFVTAVLRAGNISVDRGRLSVEIPADVADVALYVVSVLKDVGIDAEIEIKNNEQGAKRYVCVSSAARILDKYKVLGTDGKNVVKLYSGMENAETDEQSRAYIIGYFLIAGTVSIPSFELTSSKNGYKLEIPVVSEDVAEQLKDAMEKRGVDIKISERRNLPCLTIRDAQSIADFLSVTGANDAVFELQNVSIMKDTKNQLNRVNNCSIANMNKTATASANQRDAINKIIKLKGLDYLGEQLKEIAQLRLDNPFATLDELAKLSTTPISKSGIKHRLNKIVEISDDLRE